MFTDRLFGSPCRQSASMNCAKPCILNTEEPNPRRHKPAAWWSASKGASPRCCTHTTPTAHKTGRRRSTGLHGYTSITLAHETPVKALKSWKMKEPDLFVKNVPNHSGPDSIQRSLDCNAQRGFLCLVEQLLEPRSRSYITQVRGI